MVFTESESKKPPEHIEAYEGNRCLSPPPSPPSEDSIFTMPLHPLDIKPAGNAFTAVENLKLSAGLFSNLPDDLVIQILDLLGHRLLISLGGTCKALYAFCRFDDLWKTLFIEYVDVLFCSALHVDGPGLDSHLQTCSRHRRSVSGLTFDIILTAD